MIQFGGAEGGHRVRSQAVARQKAGVTAAMHGHAARRVGILPAIARRNRWLRQGATGRRPAAAHDDPWARDVRLARLEAILFLAREPLSTRRLAQLAGLADGTEARTLVRRLNRLYDGGGSPFRAEEIGGGFQLLSRDRFGSWLRRLYPSPLESRLSAPALETLAVVAYRQPVLKSEIDGVRGVDCGEILRQLMDRDLVRMTGRARELGRPYLYGTTKRFLRHFGLRSLDDLPRAAELRRRGSESSDIPTA
jgi:segregation and condensation protein B